MAKSDVRGTITAIESELIPWLSIHHLLTHLSRQRRLGKARAVTSIWGLRGTIAALAAFMALTAIQGAIFVVPTMPRSVLHQGILALFSDFTIPALALGVLCGGAALVTLCHGVRAPTSWRVGRHGGGGVHVRL